MEKLILAALLFCSLATFVSAASQERVCCTHQPAAILRVEKIRTDTRYRVSTRLQHYKTKCGTFGWRRCGRTRTLTSSTAYKVDIYARKSYPQPCAKYDCCKGYTMVKGHCYASHEVPKTVDQIADIKDALKDVEDVGLGDIINAVHGVIPGK